MGSNFFTVSQGAKSFIEIDKSQKENSVKVIVTGANGFLGAWLTGRLLAEGHDVTALVRKNSDLSELEKQKPRFAYGDVTDKKSLREAFKAQDIVFHLAGVVAYKKSSRPLMDEVNVNGTP